MSMSVNGLVLDARALRPRSFDPSLLLTTVRSQLRRTLAGMREARRLRASMAALETLDSRTLKDIGFDRSEIASVVLNPEGERRRGR
jgi:uncharacterized protein YjiS (DUF1127 family)